MIPFDRWQKSTSHPGLRIEEHLGGMIIVHSDGLKDGNEEALRFFCL